MLLLTSVAAMSVPVVALRLQRGNPEGDVVTHSLIHFVVLSSAFSV